MQVLGFLLAALVGISLGLIGGGGSILTVPILVYVIGLNPVLATSYSLFIVGSTSLVGAVNNHRKGLVDVQAALLFGATSIGTVFLIRKFLLPAIPPILFHIGQFPVSQGLLTMVLFAILMLLAAIAMIRSEPPVEKASGNRKEGKGATPAFGRLLLNGVFIGVATGVLGAGGGFLIIPALVLLLRMPMKQAVGTSLLIIALNSLIGFLGDLGHFTINWIFLVAITAVATGGIFLGSWLSRKIDGDRLKKGFGWFVLVMGIYIISKELLSAQPIR